MFFIEPLVSLQNIYFFTPYLALIENNITNRWIQLPRIAHIRKIYIHAVSTLQHVKTYLSLHMHFQFIDLYPDRCPVNLNSHGLY